MELAVGEKKNEFASDAEWPDSWDIQIMGPELAEKKDTVFWQHSMYLAWTLTWRKSK